MHFPGLELELGAVYFLHSMRNGHRIRVKTPHPEGCHLTHRHRPVARSELDGARDLGFLRAPLHRAPQPEAHPQHGGLPGLPLRKDYPLEDPTREDKNDTFFGR
jgi:NADH-quinone oxidoreductase subunit C